jgi:hypothetical protein
MKLMGTILLVIPMSAVILPAQSPVQQGGAGIVGMETRGTDQQSTRVTVIHGPVFANQCPVTLHAGHLADGSFVKTAGAHARGIGQWLSLSLASPEAKMIAKATLVVRGVTPKGHVTQAVSADGVPAHVVRTFHVSFSPGPGQTSRADLWVPGMSAVERIDLLEADYDDGVAWKAADGQSCRVTPDMKMLISSR